MAGTPDTKNAVFTESYKGVLGKKITNRFEVLETRHAAKVLKALSPEEFDDIKSVLGSFVLRDEHLTKRGGNLSDLASELEGSFGEKGWLKTNVEESVVATFSHPRSEPFERDAVSRSYEIDAYKGEVCLEVEWNAKDGNLDRDLAFFAVLHRQHLISVGVIVLRHHESIKRRYLELRPRGKAKKDWKTLTTSTTTTVEKLRERLARGDGGGCPILALGITDRCQNP